LTRDEALMLSTWSGISTARRVNHLSGRGIGLDVVRDTVERLGGVISIRSEKGRGTQISLEVPLRMALIQTLLVRSSDELYALPMDAGLRALKRDRDTSHELVRLPSLRDGDHNSGSWVVEIKVGGERLGLLVDEVVGRREIVVKPLPPPLGRLSPYAGAAVLESGAIVLVVDPLQLR
jgi:two-component system chemotaxis sensor kinase CheA